MLTHLVIRDMDLGPGVVVAPMVGITDLPFRRMCRRFGADLAFCEMVAGPMLAASRKKKIGLRAQLRLATEPEEKPFAVQLFGSVPEALAAGAEVAAEDGADLIDLNMGCPTRHVAGSGSGSGLLKDPERARQCVAAIRAAVPRLPFTVKIRAGWDLRMVNGVEIACIAEGEGADAITVHGRLRSQTYREPADWNHIAGVVRAVKIPVIGNGDIMSAADAAAMVERTGCSGVMLARGVRGNPWLIRDVKAILTGSPSPPPPTAQEKYQAFMDFWYDLARFKSVEYAVKDIRKHLIWFTRGMRNAVALRVLLPELIDEETLVVRVKAFFDEAADPH